jgi:putative aldouronate transport system permease protein
MKKKRAYNYLEIKPATNVFFNILFIFLSLLAIIPFIFVIIISFTSDESIQKIGYSFFPTKFSLSAYQYMLTNGSAIMKSFSVSVFITIVGTIVGLVVTAMYAYVLSRKTYPYRKFFTMAAVIPMLFTGGMVATYLVVVKFCGMGDSLNALIWPAAISSLNIFILKSFFITSVPDALIESAKIDGAGEWKIFFSIVIPISTPGIATIALFLTLGYWNNWFNAMLYINNQDLVPLQYFLIKIENNINALQQLSGQSAAVMKALRETPSSAIQMVVVIISVLPIACTYPFFQRYFVGGLSLGAVKE